MSEKSENKNFKKLNENDTKKTSGGYIYSSKYSPYHHYKVIDDAIGSVLGRYTEKFKAERMARLKMQDDTEISESDLRILRSNDGNENNYNW